MINRFLLLMLVFFLAGCEKNIYIEFATGLPADDMKCSKPFPSENSVARFEHGGSKFRMDRAQLILCQNNMDKGYLKSFVYAEMVGRPATHAYIDQSGALVQHIKFVPLAEAKNVQRNFLFYLKEYGLWLIIALFVLTLLFLKKIKSFQDKKSKQMVLPDQLAIVWDRNEYPATDVIQSLSAGAVLSTINGFPLNLVNPQYSKQEMQEWLEGSWHIFDAPGLDFQFHSLMSYGHAYLFDRILRLCFDEPEMLQKSSERILDKLAKEFAGDVSPADLKEHLDYLPSAVSYIKEKYDLETEDVLRLTTKAYDIDRAVTITRVAVGAGFLPNKAGLNYIMSAGNFTRDLFSGWEEFSSSLLLGRAIWGGVEGNADFNYRVQAVNLLLNDPQSPWVKVGWWPPYQEAPSVDQDEAEDEMDQDQPKVIH